MESDEIDKICAGTSDAIEPRGAVNATILDYYKKFGRKRDLEQFFSLSTAQSDIKDTSGLFWRKMKNENDSSDSGDRKSDSSHEVCRISIRCSLPDPSSSQDDDEQKTKTESPHTESPPIITEEAPADTSMRHTDDEFNFDDNNSQKSLDALLDLSTHKPLSPTSSITSQRKLEWDSLADVGYGNESDRKNSASSLSTLERLALKQQYSNNDSKQDIGAPTSHSTPLDENDGKSKNKKGLGKKTTKIYKKDVDFVEVNVPHSSDTNQAPSINVNLTKHISFNVEKDGGISIDNNKKDVSVSPEKISATSTPYLGMDKEIQTSLTKDKQSKEKSNSFDETPKTVNPYNQKIPVMISLNTLRKRLRRKKFRNARRRLRTKKEKEPNKDVTQEKSGEQLSEAESFEYMPGHMYHQNQINDNQPRPDNAGSTVGNKSSLESSGPLTTDSSKGSNHSLTKDLEKCMELLKVTLQKRYDDGTKKKLIKDIVQRLINSKYRDDETTTEFLSGLTFDSKKLAKRENNTTTSTSDANNTEDSSNKKPKKSILRNEKFNPNVVASTSQSAPNLFSASSEKVNTNLMKALASNTDSDVSSREKTSSENAFPRTSSEELYLKYLEALRREEAYKRHLKEKEKFLKQKLVSSETAFKVPVPISQDAKVNKRLKDLMKDLTRNNYDDGSGDASKLEGASSSNMDFGRFNAMRSQRSHSVFTLSSNNSECQKRPNLKKKMQAERDSGEAGPSKHHYCCCPHHYLGSKVDCVDSSVQVSIKPCEEAVTNDRPCQTKQHECLQMVCECKKCKSLSPKETRVVPDNHTGEIKYVCLCGGKQISSSDVGDNFMIYKCSKLTTRGVQLEDPGRIENTGIQCASTGNSTKDDRIDLIQPPCQMHTGTESSSSDNTSKHGRRHSKSSQTNMVVNMCLDMRKNSSSGSEAKNLRGTSTKCIFSPRSKEKCITVCEATRCLQTEISINPQISDPQLSDINIVGSKDCARLISENRRRVSFHSSDSEGGKSFSDVCTNSTSGKLLIQSAGSVYRDVKSKISEDKKEVPKEPYAPVGKDYTIPIQGTNMTLRVNLTGNNKKAEQVNECIDTDNITYADVASSAIEENKSTQCSGIILCKCTNSQRDQSCKICTKESSVPKKCLTDSSTNCNTFPKIDVSSNKPSLRRANTDTGKLTICSCVQTDYLKAKDCEPNNNQPFVVCNDPINQVITCDNSCQVEKYEENYKENNKKCECKDQITNRKCDSCNTTIKINIGIQKDFYDDKPNKECEEPKPECEKTQEECDEPKKQCKESEKERDVPKKEFGKPKEVIEKPKEENYKPVEEREISKQDFEEPKKGREHPRKEFEKPIEVIEKPKEDGEKPKENRDKLKEYREPPKEEKERKERPVEERGNPEKEREKPKEELEKPKEVCEEPKKERKKPIKEREKPKEESEKRKEECEESEKEYEDLKRESEVEVGTEKAKTVFCCCVGHQTENKPPKKDKESKNVCCCCVGSKTGDKPCKEKGAYCKSSCSDSDRKKIPLQSDTRCYSVCCPGKSSKGPVLDMIQDITRRYSKTEMIKMKKNKCFSEIITVLNYLLETEDSTDPEPKISCSTSTETKSSCKSTKSKTKSDGEFCSDKCVDKSVQLSSKNPCQDNKVSTESSDIPCSSDLPTTSSNSAACKVLNKIKKECEKYHQKVKCRGRKCEVSSSTSANCEKCKKVHYCGCKSHKCKRSKAFEKLQKKCIAYNLIIQTSESMLSEETVCEKKGPPLKNVIVRVPKRKCDGKREGTCKEQESCRPTPRCSPRCSKNRSRSCPDECETSDEYPRRVEVATVREYLEQNRPDFVEKTSQRQHCLKFFSERRANERAAQRDLLSLHVEQQPDLTNLSSDELRQLAKQIGLDLRKKKSAPKFINEREFKKHSERIYKTLPEVVQKKEEKRKENIKKTNLLMANIFKKNLQKQALRGSVNLSNYNSVIKI